MKRRHLPLAPATERLTVPFDLGVEHLKRYHPVRCQVNGRGELYVVAQAILFGLIATGPWQAAWRFVPSSLAGVVGVTGGMLLLLGGASAVAAVFTLGSNLSPLPHPKAGTTLVTSGPYRLVRHPIYSGVLLMSLGWALVNASSLTLFYGALLTLLFDRKARREERALQAALPEYADYQKRSKRLLPFLY